jgi:hypothetical protein
MSSSIECSICYDELSDIRNRCITLCSHTFCMTCFIKTTKNSNLCPLCRTELYTQDHNENEDDEIETILDSEQESEEDSDDEEYLEVNPEEELSEAQQVIRDELEINEVIHKTEDIADYLQNAGITIHDLVCYAFNNTNSRTALARSASRRNIMKKIDRILDSMDEEFCELGDMMAEDERSRKVHNETIANTITPAPIHYLVPRRKV